MQTDYTQESKLLIKTPSELVAPLYAERGCERGCVSVCNDKAGVFVQKTHGDIPVRSAYPLHTCLTTSLYVGTVTLPCLGSFAGLCKYSK